MATISDTRRARLEVLIAQHGGSLRALAETAGLNEAYLSQIRTRQPDSKTGRPRQMGDKLARTLEARCSLPAGWMDESTGMSPEASSIATLFDQLPPAAREQYAAVILAMLRPLTGQ